MYEPDDKELDQLEKDTAVLLNGYLVKTPDRIDTANLLGRLQSHFDAIRENSPGTTRPEHSADLRPSLWKLCRHQLFMYNKWFWLLSLLLFAMLLLLNSPYTIAGSLPGRSSYSLAFPLLLVCGFLYQYRSWNEGMRMIESVTPYPPALLMFSRLIVLLVTNAVLGLIGSLYTFATMSYSRSWMTLPFLFDWIAPLLLVTGLTAYFMMKRGMLSAIMAALTGWGVELFMEEWLRRELTGPVWNWALILQAVLIAAGILFLLSAYRKSLRLTSVQGWRSA
ncbi:hypothetical protein P4H65_02760 [Paenibacillus chitinolyticus]|uniref:hypothetical protein n=1 Tax=Paenibacillus chitinolyticus TaxID=79263 RepID=UPI002DB7EF1D|nr:hypothetical protein [Paenibacillus chitinolyticus]MEC0244737.1 hypothetical protein [Paenibacillus chitinolyticus]